MEKNKTSAQDIKNKIEISINDGPLGPLDTNTVSSSPMKINQAKSNDDESNNLSSNWLDFNKIER